MKALRIFCLPFVIGALLIGSCASTPPEQVRVAAAPTVVAQPEAAAKKPAAGPGDYFAPGVVLAGGVVESFMGDLYTVPFHAVIVITEPSAATKGEGLVRLKTGPGKPVATEYWTPYIVQSRPATKDELRIGMLVFVTGDAYGRTFEELAVSTDWSLRRVKDLSDLFKGLVILEYYDSYGNAWKSYAHHVSNIRVITGDFSPELRK